jgi:hypothetical protein
MIKNLLATEPVRLITAVTTLVSAIIALLPLFGVPLTAQQAAGIMAVWLAFAGVLSSFLIRGQVTPVANPRDNDGASLVPQQAMVP